MTAGISSHLAETPDLSRALDRTVRGQSAWYTENSVMLKLPDGRWMDAAFSPPEITLSRDDLVRILETAKLD